MSWSQQRWELTWQALKDVLLTGTGLVLILTQVWARSPSDLLLATGLALTVPSVAAHAKVLLSSGSAPPPGHSSPSTPPSGPSPSSGPSPTEDGDGDDEP